MADQELSEAAKQRLAGQREAVQRSHAEFAQRTKGRPTPTQEENDQAAMGKRFEKLSEDGSDPDLGAVPVEHRQMEGRAGERGSYQTRQSTAR
jgi:hypothetical protein